MTNLNVAEEKLAEAKAKGDLSTAIALQPSLVFNGGGRALRLSLTLFGVSVAEESRHFIHRTYRVVVTCAPRLMVHATH